MLSRCRLSELCHGPQGSKHILQALQLIMAWQHQRDSLAPLTFWSSLTCSSTLGPAFLFLLFACSSMQLALHWLPGQ